MCIRDSNNSIRYATAVYQLAEAIAGREVAATPAAPVVPNSAEPTGA